MLSCRKSNAKRVEQQSGNTGFSDSLPSAAHLFQKVRKIHTADRLCRSGTGRHKWRPYGLRREPADAKQHSTASKRRGATCDARMTDAKQHSTARKRRGATRDARMTTAKQHSTTPKRGGATRDARMTTAKQHSTTPKRGGATCDARMTTAMPRTGRHKTTFDRPANARAPLVTPG